MKNKIFVVIICMFLIGLIIPVVSASITFANDIIYVDDDGGADYTRIQDAIDNSSDGDTIYVYNGIYYENIIIEGKSIILVGEDKDSTIIDAGRWTNSNGNVVLILNSNNVSINGFTIQNNKVDPFTAGINVKSSSGCMISNNNIIWNAMDGIELYQSSNNIISSNVINGNRENGILLYGDSNNNVIENNKISTARNHGIDIINSCNNIIIGNHIDSSPNAGISLYYFSNNNQIYNNTLIFNDCGIKVDEFPINNSIYHNNFFGNHIQAQDRFPSHCNWNENYWDDWKSNTSKPIFGRYWSSRMSYLIPDSILYSIPWITFDNNPLSEPFGI